MDKDSGKKLPGTVAQLGEIFYSGPLNPCIVLDGHVLERNWYGTTTSFALVLHVHVGNYSQLFAFCDTFVFSVYFCFIQCSVRNEQEHRPDELLSDRSLCGSLPSAPPF